MPAGGELQPSRGAHATLEPVVLLHRAVFVVHALDRQDRTRDLGQERLDIPSDEIGMQPDVIPTPEGAFDIVMVSRELRAQVAVEIRASGGGDAVEAVALDE